jgi:aryl-alcohol dehydrogenase-like predicted oxidoreductase
LPPFYALVAHLDPYDVTHRPGVTGPIIGPRTVDQLTSALRALDLELTEEVLTSLDEIFPGPGPAPEAFAW